MAFGLLQWFTGILTRFALLAVGIALGAGPAALPLRAGEAGPGAPPVLVADFYVAPNGNDSNPGTAEAPFATPQRARDAVRERVAAGLSKDVLVFLRGGRYPQTAPLEFGPADSGTRRFSIMYAAYPGETVTLDGGRAITGWKKGRGEIWTAPVPEAKAGTWYFRQLFVAGHRAVRARTPNVDAETPWWIVQTAAEKPPYEVTVNGPIRAYANLGDVEFICNYNNEGSRERLVALDEPKQVLTITPQMKFNSKVFQNDWALGRPEPGKPCYLENALEMLDQPGEWYLDRATGVLHYWPRPGEDLARDAVVAPVAQTTLLAVRGTPETPVRNLHFKGVRVAHVDWPLPEGGYMGLFSCNVSTGSEEKPGHRFIDAAVEMEHALGCDFVDGAIQHVGANGICLRDGTGYNVIEGNEIADIGGNGVGAGACNVAGGYIRSAAAPGPDEYRGYRIANNHVHDCGTDYFGGSGICLYLSQEAVIAHNLVHDTAYFGIVTAGSPDPKNTFTKNNTVEYNHIYRAMKVTVDGAGLYITYAYHGRGSLVRGNLVHDTLWNQFGRGDVKSGIHDTKACHGLYLDGDSTGCRYEANVVYRNAGGPLLFNSKKPWNQWHDNLFQKDGTPPEEFLAVLERVTGLEPAYRRSLLGDSSGPCHRYELNPSRYGEQGWTATQFDRPDQGQGVVQILREAQSQGDRPTVVLHDLDPSARYALKGYVGRLAPADEQFFAGTFFGNCDKNLFTTYLAALGDLPILSDVRPLPSLPTTSGRELSEGGLPIQLDQTPQVIWVIYERQ